MRLPGALFRCAGLAAALCATPALAYDDSWFKSDFWGGEYPGGFTLARDVNTKIRAKPLPDAPRDIDCALNKGETYHVWNETRVKSSRLEFISYVKKVTYRIKKAAKVMVYDAEKDADREVSFQAGDTWTYLTYFGEGMFLMELNGKEYEAEQDLFEISHDKGDADPAQDEWMKLTCANGAKGWLLYADVSELPEFEVPDFPEYGRAEDKRP